MCSIWPWNSIVTFSWFWHHSHALFRHWRPLSYVPGLDCCTVSHASYPCDLSILTLACLKRYSHFKCKQKQFWVRKHRENKANINLNLEVIVGVIEAGWHSPPRTVQPNSGRHIIYAPASALFVEAYPWRVIDKLDSCLLFLYFLDIFLIKSNMCFIGSSCHPWVKEYKSFDRAHFALLVSIYNALKFCSAFSEVSAFSFQNNTEELFLLPSSPLFIVFKRKLPTSNQHN